jgi:hypothetical protein
MWHGNVFQKVIILVMKATVIHSSHSAAILQLGCHLSRTRAASSSRFSEQPDLQLVPLRTDRAVEAAAKDRRLKSEDQNQKGPKTYQQRMNNRQKDTNERSSNEIMRT